jgi:hypothetical protein
LPCEVGLYTGSPSLDLSLKAVCFGQNLTLNPSEMLFALLVAGRDPLKLMSMLSFNLF